MPIKLSQIRIVLDQMRTKQGEEAVATILKKFGATDATTINPNHYPEIMRLTGHAELARDEDRKQENVPAALNALAQDHYSKGKPVPADHYQTIVKGAKSVAEGFDRIGRALNAGRKDVAS
jgi:hypothetical protein